VEIAGLSGSASRDPTIGLNGEKSNSTFATRRILKWAENGWNCFGLSGRDPERSMVGELWFAKESRPIRFGIRNPAECEKSQVRNVSSPSPARPKFQNQCRPPAAIGQKSTTSSKNVRAECAERSEVCPLFLSCSGAFPPLCLEQSPPNLRGTTSRVPAIREPSPGYPSLVSGARDLPHGTDSRSIAGGT